MPESNKNRLYIGFWNKVVEDDHANHYQAALLVTPKSPKDKDVTSTLFRVTVVQELNGTRHWQYRWKTAKARTDRLAGVLLLGKLSKNTLMADIDALVNENKIPLPAIVSTAWSSFYWTAAAVDLVANANLILGFDKQLAGRDLCTIGYNFTLAANQKTKMFADLKRYLPACDTEGKEIDSEIEPVSEQK